MSRLYFCLRLLAIAVAFPAILVYMLVAIGTPLYLKRLGALRLRHILISVASVALILIAIEGSIFPVPEWPLWIIPYVFALLVAAGVGYFLYLRWRAPAQLLAIEADLLARD